jgi:signal transduction histidine kinase
MALLLMALVFGGFDVTSMFSDPGYTPPWYGYLFLLAAWLLNRAGRYTVAALLTLAMFPIVIFVGLLAGRASDPKASLAYLVVGVMLSSILLPARGTAAFAAACVALVLLVRVAAPGAVPTGVSGPLALLVIGAGLAVVSIHHRNRIEQERQAELRRSEERLRVALGAAHAAEAGRKELIADLHAKNAELERFTYTVSHDLKSPLITVRAYADAMAKDAASGRLERLQKDAARILAATERMSQLLGDLLELSRVGRVAARAEDVPLAALAEEAVQLLRGRLAEREVEVRIAPDLPVARGDRARLLQVFQNLIDNAAKFMGPQPRPFIEIGCASRGAQRFFYVRDNGVGIDPRYHDKVFGLFDKLDPRGEGTGIGLALVKRIVEVHGGHVWVESEGEGRGSTFCFTLARDASAEPERGDL